MTNSKFKLLLDNLRALILKSRPAYRDYIGEEDVIEKTVLISGKLSADGESVNAKDAFKGFIEGETYKVIIGEETVEATAQYGSGSFSGCIVIGSLNVMPSNEIPGWMICVYNENLLGYGAGEWVGKSVEVFTERTVKVDRWDVKKLPEECLPDGVAKQQDVDTSVEVLASAVRAAQTTADAAVAASDKAFTFTITPTDGPGSQRLSATRAEMLAALDAGKTLRGYWTETKTSLQTTDTIKHEFRLESVSGTGADRGLAFVNYEQFYKSTLYVNGNGTISFVDKEVLPAPMTKTEAMTQSVGMDDDGRLWTEPGASGDDKFFDVTFTYNDKTQQILSDKTYQQVREAIVARNKIVRAVFNADGFVSTSYRDTNNSVVFSQYRPNSTRSAASSVGFAEITMNSDNSVSYNDDVSVNICAPYILGKRGFFMESSTALSTKMFKITVDDNGTLTATEVTETT